MSKSQWTKEDVRFLSENWNNMSAPELGKRLDRTGSSVRQKGAKLGLKTDAERFEKITGLKSWTKDDDEYLAKSWGNIKKASIAIKLGRTTASVERRAHGLGLKMTTEQLEKVTHMKMWTPEMESFLIENYKNMPIDELCEKLGRTEATVKRRASSLGVTDKIRRWTQKEEEYLLDYWGERSVVTTAKHFRTSISSIKVKAYKMGLGKQMEATGKWYTTKDVKELLGVGKRTVYGWMDAGIIKFNKIKVGEKAEYNRVSLTNLRIFLENYPNKYDIRQCDARDLKAIFAKAKVNNSDSLIIADVPLWLAEKIKNDWQKPLKTKPKEWTMKELRRLDEYIDNGYNNSEIAERMNRSNGSIKAQVYKSKQQQELKYSA